MEKMQNRNNEKLKKAYAKMKIMLKRDHKNKIKRKQENEKIRLKSAKEKNLTKAQKCKEAKMQNKKNITQR